MRRRSWLLAIGLLLALPGPAAAQAPATKAKRLLAQAVEECGGPNPEKGVELFEQALKEKALPEIHLAFGDCYRKLAQCEKAIEQYRLFVQLARRPKLREQGNMLIQLCEEEIAARPPPPASVPFEQASATEAPPDLRAQVKAAPKPPPPPPRRRLRPYYFWAGVGVTAALLITGTATGVVALQKSSRYNDLTTPEEELWDLRESGQTMKTVSTATFAAAGATGVATAVLFFFTDFKRKETVSAAPLPGGALVLLGGQF